jgi:uncharacterized protein YxeA
MKKAVIIIIAVFILLLLVFKSRAVQDYANTFVESNVSHEQKKIQDFLSQ